MKNVNAKKEIPLDQLKLSINTPTHVLEYKNQDQVQSRCKSSNIKIKKTNKYPSQYSLGFKTITFTTNEIIMLVNPPSYKKYYDNS